MCDLSQVEERSKLNRQSSPSPKHKVPTRTSDPPLPPRSESFSSGGMQPARTPPIHRPAEPQVCVRRWSERERDGCFGGGSVLCYSVVHVFLNAPPFSLCVLVVYISSTSPPTHHPLSSIHHPFMLSLPSLPDPSLDVFCHHLPFPPRTRIFFSIILSRPVNSLLPRLCP